MGISYSPLDVWLVHAGLSHSAVQTPCGRKSICMVWSVFCNVDYYTISSSHRFKFEGVTLIPSTRCKSLGALFASEEFR